MTATKTHDTSKSQAHGIVYPFDAIPDDGQPIEVAQNIYWYRLPLPMTLDHINVWLLRESDGWTIIDTGIDTPQARHEWEGLFSGFLQSAPIKRVIVTHLHPDHVGLAGWLVERFGGEFMMSRTDYIMCRLLAADTGHAVPEEGMRFYRNAGFSDAQLRNYRERFGGFGRAIYRIPHSYTRLQQGEHVTIGDNSWRVEIGTGHAPEHVCLYCPEQKVVISGDQILPRISSNVSIFPTEPWANPLEDWLASCAHMGTILPDDTLVLPSHNEPFYGLRARLAKLIERHESALQRLTKICKTPRCATDSDVFSALFKRPVPEDAYFMATGESLAHLVCLTHRGILRSYLKDNIRYFETIGDAT